MNDNDNISKLYKAFSKVYDNFKSEDELRNYINQADDEKIQKLYNAFNDEYDNFENDFDGFKKYVGYGVAKPEGNASGTTAGTASDGQQWGGLPIGMQTQPGGMLNPSNVQPYQPNRSDVTTTPAPMRVENRQNPRKVYSQADGTNGTPVYQSDVEPKAKSTRKPVSKYGDKMPLEQRDKNIFGENYRPQEEKARLDLDLQSLQAQKRDVERLLEESDRRIREAQSVANRGVAPGQGAYGAIGNAMNQTAQRIPEALAKEYRDLQAAKRKIDDAIVAVERNKNNDNFVEAAGTTLGRGRTWAFGIPELIDAVAMSDLSQKDLSKTENITEGERQLLNAQNALNYAQSEYSKDDTFWQKSGDIFANMFPFMLDIGIGKGIGMVGKLSSLGTKLGTEAAAKVGAKGLASKFMRYTGTAIGDIAASTALANTVQGAKTASNILERSTGDLVIDDNGNYLFSNGENIGSAIYKGEMSEIIENFTEMRGDHVFDQGLNKIGTWLGKKFGIGAVSDFITRMSKSELAQLNKNLLGKVGIQGTIAEVLEEEEGMVLNAAFVGDTKWGDIVDPKQQSDLVFGMFFTTGLLHAPGVVGGIHDVSQYYRYNHKTDVADGQASSVLTPERWNPLKEKIDETPNADIANVASDILISDEYNDDEKKAALNYMANLMKLRGYDLGTAVAARNKDGEPVTEEEQHVITNNASYTTGYDADEETRRDIFTEFGMAQEGDSDYSEKNAAWDGVVARINDEADEQMAIEREQGLKMKNPDGNIRPVTLKEKDEDGNDKEAFIIDGNVVMMSDGTMVDSEASDTMVVIYDPATGEKHQIPPSSILSVGEPTSWEDYDYELQRRRDEYVQKAMDDAQGTVRVELGQQLTMPDGRQGVVTALSPDGELFTVVAEDGSDQVEMKRSDLQQVYDEYVMTDYQERHPEEQQQPAGEPAGTVAAESPALPDGHVQGAPTEFLPDMEITIVDDEGNEQPATILGRVRSENFQYVPDEEGNIIEYMVGGQVKHDNISDLGNKVVSFVQEEPSAATTEEQQPLGETAETVTEQTAEEPQGEVSLEEQPAVDVMPIREDGEADYMSTTPERGHQYIYNEAGLTREEAGQFVKANIEAANKELNKLKGKSPKMGTSITKYQQEKAALQQQIDIAQRVVDYWDGVKAVQQGIVNAEAAEREERDRIAHEAAVLAEQQRQAEELAKQQEQAQRGANAVHTSIREKWDAAPKVEGVENEITLANGETVKGRYMLVESGAATPSHNPNMEFARNEGFPVDENGQTVNDRDYERDQEAQTITRQMGSSYDSRAIQAVPVVSNDGVVLSGNGRTMAGEIAAQQGTDAAYIEHLKKYPQQFGFTTEQVESMQHPRVVFVPDEAMPYTTDTFAKFNAQDMKSQSRTEQAVKLGKTVDDNTFGRIVSSINSFSTLGDFYNDPKASADAIGELHNAGVINSMQIAEMMDGEKISGVGRQMLENMLIGKAFEGNPDAIRQLSEYPSMRQSVVSALAEIANNIKLGEEYALASELSQAIDLAYQARKSGIGAGEKVSGFARQGNLFAFDEGDTVADYTNLTVMMLADCINDSRVSQLKKVLALYNDKAASSAAGQFDMFSGGIMTKEEIIKDVLNILNYGTEQEQQSALAGAAERRQATAGIQEDGTAGTGGAGSGNSVTGQSDLTQAEVNSPLQEKVALDKLPEDYAYRETDINELYDIIDSGKFRIIPEGKTVEGGRVQFKTKSGKTFEIGRSKGRNHGGKAFSAGVTWTSQNGTISSGTARRIIIGVPGNSTQWRVGHHGNYSEPTDFENIAKGKPLFVKFDSEGNTDIPIDGMKVWERRGDKFYPVNIDEVVKEKVASAIESASSEVDTNPTEAQKKAGNYKMGHVTVDGYNITIENPKGSVRRGTDPNGKAWEQEMHNTYGYIRGTEGVDGDHIDVFLSDDPTQGDVFVVDQVDPSTGKFDEHKVMYGFADVEAAKEAYLSNYEEGWKGLGEITHVSKEEFKKWVDSSHRKTKPFSEYSSVASKNKRLEEEYRAKVIGEDIAEGREFGYYYTDGGRKQYHSRSNTDTRIISKADYDYAKAHGGKMFPAGEQKDIEDDNEEQQLRTWFIQQWPHRELEDVIAAIEGSDNALNKQNLPKLKRFKELWDSSHERTRRRASDGEAYKTAEETFNVGDKVIYNGEKYVVNNINKDFGDVRYEIAKTVDSESSQVVEPNELRKDEPAGEAAGTEAGEQKSIFSHPVDVERSRQLRQTLAEAYRGGNREEIQKAVEGIHQYLDEGKDFDSEYSEDVEDYEGNDPEMLADRFITHALHDRYLDTDEDQGYIKTGIRSDVAGEHGNYTITPKQYTTKRGNVLDMHLVKFSNELDAKERRAAIEMAKEEKGWWSREDGGFMMRSEESAKRLAERIMKGGEAVEDAQPLSLQDVANTTDSIQDDNTNNTIEETKSSQESKESETGEEVKQQSKWVDAEDAERFEELRQRMRQKLLGQMNMGVDPEILAIGIEMSYYVVKHGAKVMRDYAKEMIEILGNEIRPYLKAFYNGVRDMPEMEDMVDELTPYDEVRTFDVMNFDNEGPKDIISLAANVVKEDEASNQAEEATTKLKKQRNDNRKVVESGKQPKYRPATEADLSNGQLYYEGKPVYVMMVVHKGEQVDAQHFSEPEIESIYLTNGKNVKLDDLSVIEVPEKSKKRTAVQQSQLSLFGEEEAPTTEKVETKNKDNDENTNVQSGTSEAGRGGHKPQSNAEVGRSAGDETKRPVDQGVAGRNQAHPGDNGERSGRVSGVLAGDNRVERPVAEQPKRNLNNNHVERGTDFAPKDVDRRIEANIAAIEKMQELIEDGRQATPKDMEILRKFSGWGGLGKAFQEKGYGYGYDPTATSKRLKALLGDEAYEQANMSRNSAYYTPSYVIDTMWDIARAMGFNGGNVLEGSAGIGNIIGLMPQDMSERSNIQAVEIDSTTGNILKLLYPDAKVDVQGFEATQVENGSIDLAITNVPFVPGMLVPKDTSGDSDLSKKFHNSIQDFCIAKNIRKLREGGIGIFITSSSTLDNSTRLREWVVQEGGADVVGAFRLNNDTFGGTGATSDIIVVRKRVNGQKSPNAIDVLTTTGERTAEYDTGETKKVKGESVPIIKQLSMDYNKYFVEHPEMMGGEMKFGFEKDNNYRPTSKSLYPVKEKNQSEMLDAFVRTFDGKVWDKAVENSGEDQNSVVYSELGKNVKEGSIVVSNGRLCMAQLGYAKPLMSSPNEKKGEVIGKTITEEELIKRFQDKKVKGHTKVQCFESYKAIKDALASLLEYQTTNETDDGLQPLLYALNRAFDTFVKTYGHLHKNTSISFLKNDVDYSNILALEKFNERIDPKSGERIPEYGKTDVFSRRVVDKDKEPEPDNVKDGIIASIYVHGRVNVPWIADTISQHTEQPITEQQVIDEIINTGLGFENPSTRQIEVSYEYLSGNVREKLQQAIEANADGRYNSNIKALEKVIPMNIPAHLIDFSIGSSWIDQKLYEEYVKEKTNIDVTFVPAGGTWFMKKPSFVEEQKNRAFGIVSELLHKTIMGTELIEAAMTNKTITVSETRRRWDGSTETVVDKDATTACANKIDEIRQDFKDWARGKMQSDPDMSARIERIYNEMFNNYVPRTIPDDFVPDHFGGAATVVDGKPFSLRPHQGKAVVRSTTQPLLLAHEVGTGKTYTLITTAMEMRRLGTARKPMIVVQNATVGQFVESAKKLYPNAKVLTIEDKDHTAEGRKSFYAKIKYNDWDMIVVPQSVFERIPDSEERQIAFVQEKIEEKEMVLEQMRKEDPDGKSAIVRDAEREIEKLQDELSEHAENASKKRKERDEKKAAVSRQNAAVKAKEMLDRQTDDVENFDDMGIDALLVDEAHEYKHLGFATAMQRGVKGVDPSFSKKAQGVFLKTQAVMEKNNGRNVVFATGTPISNTAAEIWTFMRYLMSADTMKEYGIYYFDDFVRNFGNLTQMLEFTTSGKFKENNRFAGYVNLPELVRIWSGVADTVLTSEAGGVSDKIPAMEGGKAQDIYLPQTKALRSVMKYVKHELDKYDKMSGKEKKEHSYIPLTMYGIAKAAAVDARLVVGDAVDDEQSKTNEAVRQTLKSLEETKEYKGTIAIFADNYQNKHTGFNLYEDIRYKLEEAGVPAEQIVVMKSGMSVKKKLDIFDMVNRGDVRVIMGSTFTLGTGVNIQERLHTLIHLDAPNRPMDYTQRNGRILRQGNLHKDMDKPVRVLRFGVEDSLDVTAYQRLKTKGAIADSIMNGKKMMNNSMENRVLEEEEDVFGDTVAQLSGSEYAMLKNQAEKDVRKYENKKKQWEADQTYCHNEIPRLESKIRQANIRLGNVKDALKKVDEKNGSELAITIDKQKFADIDNMTDYIKDFNKKIRDTEGDMRENPYKQSESTITLKVNVNGFDFTFTTKMGIEMASRQGTLFSAIHRNMHYDCPQLGLEDIPVKQSLLREGLEDIVNNVITGNDFRERIERLETTISKSENELSQVRERDGKPFEYGKELEAAHKHLNEYTELMKKELEEKEKKYSQMDAEVEEANNVTVAEEAEEDAEEDNGIRFRDGDEDLLYRIREESAPTKTGIGYKVFVLKGGELYPPMVANPEGESTPVGVWLNADAAPVIGTTKTGRQQVKAGGKGTQGGSGQLAYRPGWHLGEIPYALQFNRKDSEGNKTLFPANFVWAEVEYANDVDYQDEAMSYGNNSNGKFQHSLAGLPFVPENGSYKYRTNPNPETDPWIITGAMKVKRILTPSEVDEMVKAAGREPQNRQEGAVTDEQVQALNEQFATRNREGDDYIRPTTIYAESLASARRAGYSQRQHDAMLKRQERNARKQFADLIEKLGLTDRVEVRDTPEGLKGRRAKAKGWYDPTTGKIVIILGNHHSKEDVMKTILHESIGHYGMRKLFGTHFDTFLDNVYLNADAEVRGRIVELAKKHGWNFRTATEEYLASMAEDENFEYPEHNSWWMKIKELFWDMLHKLGLKVDNLGVKLSDNELRYLLWRSYQNLVNPGRFRSLVDEAKDVVMQNTLKVGKFEEESKTEDNEQSEEDLQIVAEAATDAKKRDLAKQYPGVVFMTKVGNHYEATGKDAETISKVLGIKPTTGGVVRFREADLDKVLLGMIRAGHRVALVENREQKASENDVLFRDGDFTERDRAIARDHYERMLSSSGYQFQEAMQDSMLGLRKAMEAIGGGKKFRIEEVPGNENAYLAENRMSSVNAAEQTAYFREYMQPLLKVVHDIAGNDKEIRKDLVDYMMAKHGLERNVKFAERDAQAAAKKGADYNAELQKNRKKDYSGLTALTGNAYTAAAEAAAQKIVDDFEAIYDVAPLWEKVNDATKATLAKVYMSGMINEETYEQIRDMFEYYIPLRGWDETTSDEVYGYLTSKDGPLRGSTIKHAYGRNSKADDPIATIGLMADTAIRQGNRNAMKQRFLTFVQNRPSDLVSVSKLWLQYDAANDEWVPVFADINPDDSAYEVERKVKAFEERMEKLAAADPDTYKSGSDAANIPYKVVKGNINEHQVLVKRDGETFVLTINGNPRAAQALNGITNPDVETTGVIGNMLKGAEYINRQLSAFYTTRTPDFIVSNFFRDMLYSNCMTWVKENPRYALTFHKNFGKVNPATMRVLFGKWEKGTLDDSKELERNFKLFMMNGGETGYTNVKDIEGHKRAIAAELKRQGNVVNKTWHALGMQLDLLNRSVENCARFAAFLTSQELGRSIERSIYDAKEVSVNFNKKGSGGKMVNTTGLTFMGRVGSYMSGIGRLFYVFWNAGVQGMTNFGRAAKRHPGKFTAGAATMFTLGAVISLLAQAMGDDDDDDKNAYYNLPEYVRRSNICFRAGEQWITIPLPIEFRAIYGMGELATGVITNNEHYSDGELAKQMISQVSQVLPIDFMEGTGGLHAFIPSVAKPITEAASNKGWTGLPIYKDTPWNQNDPEFTKVYKSADKHIVAASRWLNEQTGGDDYKKGWADVVNPAQVEYVLNGYFGGYFKVPNQLVKMTETAFGDRDFEWRNMMIANRLVKSGDERTANRKLTNEYFKYKDEYEETKRLKKKYESASGNGVIDYAQKLNFLNNSEEYARYLIFDKYRKEIDKLYKLQNEEPDEEKRKVLESEYYNVMREMVDEMHAYEKEADK